MAEQGEFEPSRPRVARPLCVGRTRAEFYRSAASAGSADSPEPVPDRSADARPAARDRRHRPSIPF